MKYFREKCTSFPVKRLLHGSMVLQNLKHDYIALSAINKVVAEKGQASSRSYPKTIQFRR